MQASPPGLAPAKARRRAVGKGLSDLADQHGERYEDLYQQELERARSEPGPIRRGRPPGSRDQLAIRSASFARTWRPLARPAPPPATPSDGAGTVAKGQGCRERTAVLFREGHSASSVAEQLGVALETVVSWRARWRRERAAALFEEDQTASAVGQRLGIARQPP